MVDTEQFATRRQWILGGILLLIVVATAIALNAVLATVFFALTVAYVLSPPRRWLRRRGVRPIVATAIVTAGAVVGILLMVAPVVYLLVLELDAALAAIGALPETFEVEILGMGYEIEMAMVFDTAQAWLQSAAIALSARVPEYLLKFGLFAFVVFGIVHREKDIAESVMSVVPPKYRDITESLHLTARDTLIGIYVVQGITALATVALGLPVFYLLGYESWLTLALIGGMLQFVPVIGPSLLIAVLVVADLLAGDVLGAALVLLVGGIVVVASPDVVLRPRLAGWTTELSSMLYFIGFVGGLLSLGAIGIIVGPLLVALLVEAASLVGRSFEPEASAVTAPDRPTTRQ